MQIEFIPLLILRPLKKYDHKLLKKLMIYYILSTLNVNNYKKDIYFILNIPLKNMISFLENYE